MPCTGWVDFGSASGASYQYSLSHFSIGNHEQPSGGTPDADAHRQHVGGRPPTAHASTCSNPGSGERHRQRARRERCGRGDGDRCRRAEGVDAWPRCRPTSAAPSSSGRPTGSWPARRSWLDCSPRRTASPSARHAEEVDAAARILRGFGEEATRLFGRQVPMDAVPGMERHVAVLHPPAHRVSWPPSCPSTTPSSCTPTRSRAALAAGNAVIGKPPSDCPLTVLLHRGHPRGGGPAGRGPPDADRQGSRIGPLLASDPGRRPGDGHRQRRDGHRRWAASRPST